MLSGHYYICVTEGYEPADNWATNSPTAPAAAWVQPSAGLLQGYCILPPCPATLWIKVVFPRCSLSRQAIEHDLVLLVISTLR